MAEYIEREALIALFNERYDTAFVQERTRENKEHWHGVCAGLNWGRNTITDAPTADVVEVRHGELVNIADYGLGKCFGCCSLCGMTMQADHPSALKLIYGYCPNCGAKMDGKGEGE